MVQKIQVDVMMDKYSIASIKSNDTERNDFHSGSSILDEITCLQHPYRLTSMIWHDFNEELTSHQEYVHDKGFSQKSTRIRI